MVRVLHCFAGLHNGGVEAFVMSVYRNIDRSKYQFDFLLRDAERTPYWDEIEVMGGKIYITAPFPSHAFKNFVDTKRFLQQHREYDIIHVHANSLIYMTALKLSKKYGVMRRIVHSHSSSTDSALAKILHRFNKDRLDKYATIKLACSHMAAEWMFKDNNYTLIKNGVAAEKFRFNPSVRDKIRGELNIKDKFVVGNIGRLTPVKNQKFILDVFSEYQKDHSDAVLLLVGFGTLESEIRGKIEQLKLNEKVILLTDRNDPHRLLQAMDVFFFPSIYEGFGISLVEAQATGLPCLCSTAIPGNAMLSENLTALPLEENPEKWACELSRLRDLNPDRSEGVSLVREKGYDIAETCKQLAEIYGE